VLGDFRRPNARPRMQLWVAHLALVASGFHDLVSIQVARGESGKHAPSRLLLGPLAEEDPRARARGLLADLVAVHDAASRRPLPLFPGASYRLAAGESPKRVADAFWSDWSGFGDRSEAVELVYGPQATLGDVRDQVADELEVLADRVYGPLLANAAHATAWIVDHAERMES
jgi:hypothetical protein